MTDRLQNYFTIAWRNLVRNKVYSAINISGLAMGMAIAMLIGLWVIDELSFNKYHQHYGRIAQVMQHQTGDGQIYTNYATPFPLEAELRSNYKNDFKYIVLSTWAGGHLLAAGNKKFTETGSYMQPDAPDMLSLTMLKGTKDGLHESASILLAESVAKAYFGNADPVGKLLTIDDNVVVRVTGVYQDLPSNSTFKNLSFIAPWDLYVSYNESVQRARQQWDNNSFQLFVQLVDKADLAAVSAQLKDVKLRNVDQAVALTKPEIFLQPMSRWHLYSDWKNGVNVGGRIQYVWLFSLIGLFVLVLACINFMNLSTARSEKRAREVGIRKAIGSIRWQLIVQFISESFLTAGLSFVVALLLVWSSLPFFNDIADKQMIIPQTNPVFWLSGLGFTCLTGLIAGSYPAFYLSGFQPVNVLKGTFRTGRFAAVPRRVLVVVQFTVSVTLLIGTIIIFRQIQFAKNRPVGYSRAGLITLGLTQTSVHAHFDAIRDELRNSGAITDMAESGSPVTAIWQTQNGFGWNATNSNPLADFATYFITHEFGKTVGWQLKDGRDFSRAFGSDSSGMILNEAAVRYMGLKKPVSQTIRWEGKAWNVLGVVRDMVMDSPYEPAKRTLYMIGDGAGSNLTLRLNPNRSATEALGQIEAILRKYVPTLVFDYQFVDQAYGRKFSEEERIGKLASVFAILAIFISCLGMFGLASFIAEQRRKEIGVRKVLGATVFSLWSLLAKDFLILVGIAFLVATPLAWYALAGWLQQYAYRTDIPWWIFAASGLSVLVIVLLTVSYQSLKAAFLNPVESLRSE